ncbi:MAG TPA: DUF3383 family protein [Candidatus Sulfotelmatobacter sp.]|nr:DUF3383 family protein [Candidatus Sulfotelmatobacter sp.]
MTTQFPLSTIVVVSVSSPSPGFGGFNTGNLAIFTDEPYGNGFPASGIQYYQTPTDVATDFGTGNRTYEMANAVFSQQPNILQAGGQLIVVAMKTQIQDLALSGVPASGVFKITTSNGSTADINWDDTAAEIQTKVQAVTGQEDWKVTGSLASQDIKVHCYGTYGVAPAITATANTLATVAPAAITFTITQEQAAETVLQCLNRVITLTSFAAFTVNETYETIGSTDFEAAAAAVQALNLMFGVVGSSDSQNESPSGVFYANTTTGNTQTRCLSYFDTTDDNPLLYLAGYLSKLMSVDYTGSNTALTMNGKQFAGVPVDSVITSGSVYNDAEAAGSDVYISIQGTPFCRSFGANLFADQVTGRIWLKNAIQVAYANLLAQASTKIPQTDTGLDMIRAVLKTVMIQGVRNGYIAPGVWQLADTFGNQQDFLNNLANYGFYIYMPPIGSQSLSDIQDRKAPLAQIAYNEAGAVHKGSVILYVQP